jgi:hypothetical protein
MKLHGIKEYDYCYIASKGRKLFITEDILVGPISSRVVIALHLI